MRAISFVFLLLLIVFIIAAYCDSSVSLPLASSQNKISRDRCPTEHVPLEDDKDDEDSNEIEKGSYKEISSRHGCNKCTKDRCNPSRKSLCVENLSAKNI